MSSSPGADADRRAEPLDREHGRSRRAPRHLLVVGHEVVEGAVNRQARWRDARQVPVRGTLAKSQPTVELPASDPRLASRPCASVKSTSAGCIG